MATKKDVEQKESTLRKELAQPDRFQRSAGAGLDYLRERRGPLFTAGVLIVGAAVIGSVVYWFFSNTREKAGDQLSWVVDTSALPVGISSPSCGNAVVDPGESCDDGDTASEDGCDATCQIEKRTGRPPIPLYTSEDKKKKRVLDEWTRLQSELSGPAVATAKLGEATLRFDQKDFSVAASAYESFLGDSDVAPAVTAVIQENLAYALEAQGNIDGAIEAFRKLYTTDPKGFYADAGHYHVGRLLEKQGKKDEAVKEYSLIITEFPDSRAMQESAKNRLLALGVEPPEPPKEKLDVAPEEE